MYIWTMLGKVEHDHRVAQNMEAIRMKNSANVEAQPGWLAKPVNTLLRRQKNGVKALGEQLKTYAEDGDNNEKSTGEYMQPSLG